MPLGVGGASLADGPEWKPHAREEGVPGVRGQGGVGGGVGRHGPVAQRWRVDVRIEPWGEGRVGRLWHRPRDHQLQQAVNTRRRVSTRVPDGGSRHRRWAGPGPWTWCHGEAGESPGHTQPSHRHREAPEAGIEHAGSQMGKQNRETEGGLWLGRSRRGDRMRLGRDRKEEGPAGEKPGPCM